MHPPRPVARLAFVAVAACVLWLSGCATPIEVKTASKKQLELIDALDQATRDLDSALAAFHRSNQELIKNQARIGIARQSIALALENQSEQKQITADALFESYKADVRPWIDYAFEEQAIAKRIQELTARKAATDDAIEKLQIDAALKTLEMEISRVSSKPKAIAELEAVYADELNREEQSIADFASSLDVLRKQIATMKAMQARVDAWLSIDVTVSQGQVDALTASFLSAHQSLSGANQ